MSSRFLKLIFKELSNTNDYFSHSQFVYSQFEIDNENLLKSKADYLTTVVFPKNQNSKRYNVKLTRIKQISQPASDFIRKSIYLYMYTLFEVYLRNFFFFLKLSNNDLIDLSGRESIPFEILDKISRRIREDFKPLEMLTFDYLRLRRNNVVHSNQEAKSELAHLVRNKGTSLDRYWDKKLHSGLYSLSFKNDSSQEFAEFELYDLINIFRYLLKKIDSAIEKNSKQTIIDSGRILFDKECKNSNSKIDQNRVEKKFVSFMNREFGLMLQ